MDSKQFNMPFGDGELIIESGKLATLANGSVTVRYGDTVILATAVVADEPRPNTDFFPLMVDYEERLYAAGKISGSRFIKREGRPSETAVLTARLVDRSIRPLFPKDYRHDIQVMITVLAYDQTHDPDIIAIIGASTALMQTIAPFSGPVAAARVGYIDGQLVLNPTENQMESSSLDLVVAGTAEKVLMIESNSNELNESLIEEAIEFGRQGYQSSIKMQNDFTAEVERLKLEKKKESAVHQDIKKELGKKLTEATRQLDKQAREKLLAQFEQQIYTTFEGTYETTELKTAFNEIVEKEVRHAILEEEIRPDGRKLDEIRPLAIEVGLLPRVHGSGLFTRGQTQALTIATLGAPGEEQIIETMEEESTKRYMHHYNFPPFSTGEVKPVRGASRREIGHGALAERALLPVIPSREDFPYTIRLVTEVLSSNGSSSMAATCGSTLALMDAGVPISSPVVGIAIGLVTGKNKDSQETYRILTDIQGIEDFAGDMDFKVTGTEKGITAIQMDTKIDGLSKEIIHDALTASRKAHAKILEEIKKVIAQPRPELSPYAPRIYKIQINPEKIGIVIGPGGKVINNIIAEAGGKEITSIDIEEDGTILVSSTDPKAAETAISMIENITREIKPGEIFTGPVTQIIKDRMKGNEIGAIVKILPNQEGMVHISQLADQRVEKVSDIVNVGDVIPVKVLEVDTERGRISLSYKAAKQEGAKSELPEPESPHRPSS